MEISFLSQSISLLYANFSRVSSFFDFQALLPLDGIFWKMPVNLKDCPVVNPPPGFYADVCCRALFRTIPDIVVATTRVNFLLGFHTVVWYNPVIYSMYTQHLTGLTFPMLVPFSVGV